MTTGTVMPRISFVRSLNWDTNAPMFTPCWPSAGPTGGAGVAWPPVTCNRIWAVTCFAMMSLPTESHSRDEAPRLQPGGLRPSHGLHLPVFQLDRHGPPEDGQLDAHRVL